MKIIFLDFDGVLNSQLFYKNRKTFKDIDEKSVSFLNDLVRQTEAKIVVSSSWRIGRTINDLQKILDYNGFKGEILDVTPCLNTLRGNEIHAWIQDYKQKSGYDLYRKGTYVILDDDSDMLYWHRNNFLWVDPYAGLTPNLVYKAERILNR